MANLSIVAIGYAVPLIAIGTSKPTVIADARDIMVTYAGMAWEGNGSRPIRYLIFAAIIFAKV
jgi:hypothetical protein